MPPERARGPKAFKPPRPRDSTGSAISTSSKTKGKGKAKAPRKSTQGSARSTRESLSPSASDLSTSPPPRASKSKSKSSASGPSSTSHTQATNSTAGGGGAGEGDETGVGIPPALLTRLLSEFMSDGMRISKGADRAVGLYMETFVKEAVARARYEREESDKIGGGVGLGDGFLEVEDLEKLAPQLVLDF